MFHTLNLNQYLFKRERKRLIITFFNLFVNTIQQEIF